LLVVKRVLLVDDHDENLYLSQTLLENQGFAVELAHNGVEALEKARRQPPDLIVSDVLMPIMDGFALCRAWRADDRLSRIPFVFHTATYTHDDDTQLAFSLGADAFITKPVQPEAFLAEITAVLADNEATYHATRKVTEIEDEAFAEQHGDALIRMVEKKMEQAEKANRALEEEITERRQIEKSLKESEGRFRGLFERMSQGAIYRDAEGRTVLANPAAERILGLSQDQMLGKTPLDPMWRSTLDDGSDFPPDRHPAMVALRTGRSVHASLMGVRNLASDEQHWIMVDAVPQYLPGGNAPTGVFETFTDVTERKLAEDNLKRQLRFSDLLGQFLSRIASAPATEIDEHVAGTLEPAAEFAGVDSVIIFQVSDDLATWGATHSWAEPYVRSVASTMVKVTMGSMPWVEQSILGETTLVIRSEKDMPPQADDLRRLWEMQSLHSALLVPLHGRDKLVRGCLALFSVGKALDWKPQDIQQMEQLGGAIAIALERKRIEDSLRASDEQLRQSQRMEAVGQLAGGIAHDFNNLLTAIIGYGDLLLARPELSGLPARQDVEEIKRAAERASALTRQILAFSRRQTLQPTVVSLNDTLRDMEPLLRRTLGEDIELTIHLAPDLYHVKVDVHQFEQVLMNLAINARDAMTSGGRLALETCNSMLDEEYCRTHPWVTPGRYVMLVVSDTGSGMDEAILERIFEPFFTTKDVGKGTGLGLSTVYGIVKQSGGSISVDSRLGAGTTFRIYLPPTQAPVQAEARPSSDRASNQGSETILVVEDESSLRSLISRVLGSLGYAAHVVGGGDDALAILKDAGQHLDLMLTDIVLPGEVQGNTLAEQAQILRPGLPVIYMSGYAHNAITSNGRLDSAVSFLEKPFGPSDLGRKVREVLDSH
jgi:PAS domain S-box-containing protein